MLRYLRSLALAGDANRHRLEVGVINVGRDNHAAPRHLFHDQRFRKFSRLATWAISSVITP